jgi:hypothetical protein
MGSPELFLVDAGQQPDADEVKQRKGGQGLAVAVRRVLFDR